MVPCGAHRLESLMPPLEDADKTEIQTMIAEALKGDDLVTTIGRAVTGAVKGLKVDEQIKTQIAEAAKGLKPAAIDDDDDDKNKNKGGSPVAKQLEAMQKKLEAETAAREKAETARSTERLNSAARAALTAADVPGPRVKGAMALLQADGLLQADDDGNPAIKGKDEYGAEALVPLDKGVKAWLQTDDGKQYLPPANVQGTGEGGGGPPTVKKPDGTVDIDKVRDLAAEKILGAARSM